MPEQPPTPEKAEAFFSPESLRESYIKALTELEKTDLAAIDQDPNSEILGDYYIEREEGKKEYLPTLEEYTTRLESKRDQIISLLSKLEEREIPYDIMIVPNLSLMTYARKIEETFLKNKDRLVYPDGTPVEVKDEYQRLNEENLENTNTPIYLWNKYKTIPPQKEPFSIIISEKRTHPTSLLEVGKSPNEYKAIQEEQKIEGVTTETSLYDIIRNLKENRVINNYQKKQAEYCLKTEVSGDISYVVFNPEFRRFRVSGRYALNGIGNVGARSSVGV